MDLYIWAIKTEIFEDVFIEFEKVKNTVLLLFKV